MLAFGDGRHGIFPYSKTEVIVFNVLSFMEMGYSLPNLIPPQYIQEFNDQLGKSFDIVYAEYILSNPNVFIELMAIVYSIYEGKDVFILMNFDNDYKIQLAESLGKLIQQRYGYNSYIINELSDYDDMKESSFSIPGMYNLDLDKERYVLLLNERNKVPERS